MKSASCFGTSHVGFDCLARRVLVARIDLIGASGWSVEFSVCIVDYHGDLIASSGVTVRRNRQTTNHQLLKPIRGGALVSVHEVCAGNNGRLQRATRVLAHWNGCAAGN